MERFDLSVPPLMRFALIRLSAQRHRLLISNHHLLMDGWSAPVLVSEVLSAYAAGGSAASLPPVAPYRDYLAFIAGQDRTAALEAWREALGGLEEGTRLAPRSLPGAAAVTPEQVVLLLDARLSQALVRLGRERALTLNTLVQTAYGLLLGRLLGRDDVVFGVTVAGRPAELAGAERMVGLFINTLPLRLKLSPQLPLSELLRQTQDRQSALMAHQHVGLAAIQQARGLERSVRHAGGVRELPGRPQGAGAAGRRAQARGSPGPRRDALSAGADRAARRAAATAARLPAGPVRSPEHRDAGAAAGAAARGRGRRRVASDRQPGDPRAGERATILQGWNDTAHELPGHELATSSGAPATLPSLFAAQAQRTPDAVAVVFEDRELSYAALDADANRLAQHLQSLGVGPETAGRVCASSARRRWWWACSAS